MALNTWGTAMLSCAYVTHQEKAIRSKRIGTNFFIISPLSVK
jgi:hypothetical protein